MTRDASIDDFAADDGTEGGDHGDAGTIDESEAGDDGDATTLDEGDVAGRVASASPAASTSRVEPGGEACAGCGTVVERLWVADDGGEVCAACKPW